MKWTVEDGKQKLSRIQVEGCDFADFLTARRVMDTRESHAHNSGVRDNGKARDFLDAGSQEGLIHIRCYQFPMFFAFRSKREAFSERFKVYSVRFKDFFGDQLYHGISIVALKRRRYFNEYFIEIALFRRR